MSAPSPGSDGGEDARRTTEEKASDSATDEAQKASSSSGGPKRPMPKINLPRWAVWAVGAVVLLAIPFYKKLARVEGVLGKVVKAVADNVEAAVPIVKMVVEDIGDSLPENSAIAHELEIIEHVADEVAEGAEKAEAFVEKIEDIKEKVEDRLESIINEEEAKKGTA